jgi:transposase
MVKAATQREDWEMLRIEQDKTVWVGSKGALSVPPDDEITLKLAMLFEGQCEGVGPTAAARKLGYTKQRYFQLLGAFHKGGAIALKSEKGGPKTNYRRTDEVVRQVIRHRFLDADASAEVIAQKLNQRGWTVSKRSVQRIIEEFGLQKKRLFRLLRTSLALRLILSCSCSLS